MKAKHDDNTKTLQIKPCLKNSTTEQYTNNVLSSADKQCFQNKIILSYRYSFYKVTQKKLLS